MHYLQPRSIRDMSWDWLVSAPAWGREASMLQRRGRIASSAAAAATVMIVTRRK